MSVELNETGPRIEAATIIAFESRIGLELPEDYREFLLKYNGGRPGPNFVRGIETDSCSIKLFLGIRTDEYYDLDAEWRWTRGRICPEHLSIASDSFGNRFCLALGAEDHGTVYFWDHDCEADEGEDPSYDNLARLANSFTDLWVRMEPWDPEAFLAELDGQDLPE